MTITDSFFDFLRGDNNSNSQNVTLVRENISISESEKWILYTFPEESSKCTLNCLFISVLL